MQLTMFAIGLGHTQARPAVTTPGYPGRSTWELATLATKVSSTWGRNPSRASNTAGARMLARPSQRRRGIYRRTASA